MTKPTTYSPPWPIDAALFEEGRGSGYDHGVRDRSRDRLRGFTAEGVAKFAYAVADEQPRHAPWRLATSREDWAAGFREGYADGAGKSDAFLRRSARAGRPETSILVGGLSKTTPCPDGDACPDAKRHVVVHPVPPSDNKPWSVMQRPLTVREDAHLRFTLDSTVREVLEVLTPVWPVEVERLEPRRNDADDGFTGGGYEARCSVRREDDQGTRRLSALAPTHLEALVALANVVAGDGKH